jgi:hypothetical protein
MRTELIQMIKNISSEFSLDWKVIVAFIEVETGGRGFDDKTGKLIIQFEPVWFKRKVPYAPSGLWSVNKVDVQSKEWLAFNNAYSIDKDAAMQSTSIGLGQIMGFQYKRLNYSSVGEMWDDAKKGEERQVWQICKFIVTDSKLQNSIKNKDWNMIATLYNGAGYKDVAKKYNRIPYDISMKQAYDNIFT